MSIIPEAFCVGVGVALVFGIVAGWKQFREWGVRWVHRRRKKLRYRAS
jgi:hypothetical protein